MYEDDEEYYPEDNYSRYTHEELMDLVSNIIGYTHSIEISDVLSAAQEHMDAQNSEILELKDRLAVIEQELNMALSSLE